MKTEVFGVCLFAVLMFVVQSSSAAEQPEFLNDQGLSHRDQIEVNIREVRRDADHKAFVEAKQAEVGALPGRKQYESKTKKESRAPDRPVR